MEAVNECAALSINIPLPKEATVQTDTDINMSEENKETEKRNRLRKRAVDELVNTEKTYLMRLNSLFKVFVNPLKNTDDTQIQTLFLTFEEHSIIFPSDLMTIYALHTQLCAELIESTQEWDPNASKIGHILIKYGELFKMYQIYFNKHEVAVQHLIKLKKNNTKFTSWCRQQSHKLNGLTIESLLILPIQRLPRYCLILKEIIKRTTKYHIDLYHLQEALVQICEMTELINDKMKENDRRMKVRMVEKRFIDLVDTIGHLVKPSRIFIAESTSETIYRHDKYGNKLRITLFLFNDCLIYGYYSEYTQYLRFGSILIFDALFSIIDVQFDEYCNYNDIPSLQIRSAHHSLWISFECRDNKFKWLEMMNKQSVLYIDNCINMNNNMAELYLAPPVFVPDDYSDQCMDCKSSFSIILRRHHCYICGKLCCFECTKYKVKYKEEYIRVCKMCNIQETKQNDIKHNDLEMQTENGNESDSLDNDDEFPISPLTTFDITKNHQLSCDRVSKRRDKMKHHQHKMYEK